MKLPLAFLQLFHEKVRLTVAIVGVAFASILMFMQSGFEEALYDSTAVIQRGLRGDLMLVSAKTETITATRSFSRRRLYQLMGHPAVERVAPLSMTAANWKNPWDGTSRLIFVLGCEPREPMLDLPGLAGNWTRLAEPDTVLYDRASRDEYGPVPVEFPSGKPIFVEVNRRRMLVNGLFTMGASFAANGNILASDQNFYRMFPERPFGNIDLGVIRLKPGSDPAAVRRELQPLVADELIVLTREEIIELEKTYWTKSSAIGFIFRMGVAIGFLVGMVIVYQILYTDVSRHLPEYATLKAMGYTDGYFLKVVFQQSLILSILGFLPGLGVSWWLFGLTAKYAFLPMEMRAGGMALVFALTVLMCTVSGVIAMRKLREADPADVF